jgi:Zn-dependent alcohol dehydrogenase
MLGATDVVDASGADAVSQVLELTGGEGVDLSLDFVGTSTTFGQALAMARRGGTTVVTGLTQPVVELSINDLVRGGRTIKGNLMGMGNFKEEFAKLVAYYRDGQLKLDELVSREFPLAEFADALSAMSEGEVARSVLLAGGSS